MITYYIENRLTGEMRKVCGETLDEVEAQYDEADWCFVMMTYKRTNGEG